MKNTKIMLIKVIVLIVAIAAITLAVLLSGNSNNEEDPTLATTPEPTPLQTEQPGETPADEPPEEEETPEREPSAEELEFLNYNGSEMIMYHIWQDTFRELIETADRNLMLEVEQIVHYRLSEQDNMLLRFMLIHEREDTLFFRDEAEAYGVPGLTIDLTLFETFSSTEEIEKILRENGIHEPVADYVIFYHELYVEQGIPPTVVVYTDSSVYFISIEMTDGIPLNHIYTHSEYLEKYRMHDGELIVDETVIPTPAETLTFEYRQMLAPIRLILEAIECDIRIESEIANFEEIFLHGLADLTLTMYFSRNGKDYALEVERWFPGLIDIETGNYLLYVFPQDHLHFVHGRFATAEEFEFYVDETVLQNILELLGVTVEVDYTTRQLTITSPPLISSP